MTMLAKMMNIRTVMNNNGDGDMTGEEDDDDE